MGEIPATNKTVASPAMNGMAGDPLAGFTLLEQPGHLLRRSQQRSADIYAEEIGTEGPTQPQFALLTAIFQHPGASQVDLVRHTGIDRSTVAEMAARLVKRGLLRRERSGDDRRANTLAISPTGEAWLRDYLPAAQRTQQRLLDPLTEAERMQLIGLLRRLVESSLQ
ncbi:MarR family winged helix-turn-helix transcriptional regulator [Ferrovibrio sp.]|uniref:MarR family winged helix-turn-helix transcriptional regulator n=1 Tax=Ferrovibrio sp. TaxID=1917215 RepID=UPI0035B25FAF